MGARGRSRLRLRWGLWISFFFEGGIGGGREVKTQINADI